MLIFCLNSLISDRHCSVLWFVGPSLPVLGCRLFYPTWALPDECTYACLVSDKHLLLLLILF